VLEQASAETRAEQRRFYEAQHQWRLDAGLSQVCHLQEDQRLHCSWVRENPVLQDEEFLGSWRSVVSSLSLPPPAKLGFFSGRRTMLLLP
jgi:hypothetical protein